MSCLIFRSKRGVAIAEQLVREKSEKIVLLFWHARQNRLGGLFLLHVHAEIFKRYARRFLMFARCLYAKNLNPPQRRRQQLGSFCQHKNTRCKNLQFVLLQQDYVGHCLAGSSNFQIFLGNGGRFYCFQMWLGLLWPSPYAKLKNHLLATK